MISIIKNLHKIKTDKKRHSLLRELINKRTLFLMIMPAVIIVFIFSYLPMFGVILAFKDFNYSLGILGSPWAGLANFRFFFISGDALRVTLNTFTYNLSFIILNNVLSVIFAIALSEIGGRFFKRVTQSCMFLPYFISWVVVGAIAYNLFNFEFGTINGVLRALGLNPIDFYGNPGSWRIILPLFSAWRNVGYSTVIYLAAVISISPELFESAEIDGANIFKRIRYITLPSLVPTMVLLVLLAVGGIFRADFGLFFQLVGQNPQLFSETDVIDTYVFRTLLRSGDIGMSAAAGFYQSILCFITIFMVNYFVRKTHKDYSLF